MAGGDPVNFGDPFGLTDCQRSSSRKDLAACEKQQKETAEKQTAMNSCINENKFSSMIRDQSGSSLLGNVAELAEYGAPTSLALDVHAYSIKTTRDFWRGSGVEYASGLNWAAKKVSRIVGGSKLLGYAKVVGDRVSVPTAVVGAFSLGYNASIIAQCYTGVIK